MPTLLDFCTTPRQQDVISLHLQGLSSSKIAKELGLSPSSKSHICKIIREVTLRAESRGYDPENHRTLVVPSQQVISGYSDLVRYPENDPLGRILGWVKSNRKLAEQVNDARSIIESMALDVPRVSPIRYEGHVHNPHQFSVLPLGDPHIGLRTWSKEVGEEWDISIALRVYEAVFRRLLERAPDTELGILFNSGDFFHADNIAGETARSGHKLDLDGRPGYWLDAGFVLLRMLIDMCLQKYGTVLYVNTPGNHDDILGQALGIYAAHMYEREPRFSCLKGESPFQYFERGKVALGFCHGHTCKLSALPGKMADDQSEMWGRTKYRHWFTGHVHHNQWLQWKEHPGCTVESVGIIPPKDAYAYGGAYGAGRGTQLIVMDDRGYSPDRYMETIRVDD